jgi:hypothetical protein
MEGKMKRFQFGMLLGGAVAALSLLTSPAWAVDDLGLFELEPAYTANAVQDGGLPGAEDWETLYDSGANTGGTSKAFTGIVPDPGSQSIFVGGRKDIQDIPEWGHKDTGGLPDKDNLTNAYAAAYDDPDSGDLIAYFGADRFANVGDAFMGFWFFAGQVSANPDGSFSGQHTLLDVLVLANFPQANNAVPIIQAYKWDPSCSKAASNSPSEGQCAAKNLRLLRNGNTCGSADHDPCATTNDSTVTAPWPYTAKTGENDFPFESFFEGGINLSEFAGETCFSSFLAETRSSSSPTATLKDFVLGQFATCGIEANKACDDPVINNTMPPTLSYTIAGWIHNTGTGTLGTIGVTDLPYAIDTGSLALYELSGTAGCEVADLATLDTVAELQACEGLAYGGSLPGDGAIIYEATITSTTDESFSDTITATATPFGGSSAIPPAMATATCTPTTQNANLNVTKSCDVDLKDVGDHVEVAATATITVCNIGESVLSNVQVTDPQIDGGADLLSSGTSLDPDDGAPGGSDCVTITDKAFSPASLPTGTNGTFTNTVTATAEGDPFATSPGANCAYDSGLDKIVCMDTSTATCDLCPNPNPE